MSFRVLVRALRRQSWLALGVLGIELAAIAIGLRLAPRTYTAVAAITATPQQSLLQSAGNLDSLETTLAQIVDSGAVLDDVRGRIANARSVDQLRTEVSGARVNGTVLIRVTVVDTSPTIAAAIANAVVDILPLHDPSGGLLRFANVDRAQPPSSYSSPNVKIILLVGVVLGVLLAVGAALVRDNAARTVESEEELREASDTDILGVVPTPREFSPLSRLEPSAQDTTAFRAVRVALEFANTQAPIRLVVIAPAVPGVDCGWLAMNLAVALANVRRNVLVIDSDDRGRDRGFNGTGATGLYDVLRGTVPLDRALMAGPTDRVTILPSGTPDDTAHDTASDDDTASDTASGTANDTANDTPNDKANDRTDKTPRETTHGTADGRTRENLLELCLPQLIADLEDRFDIVLVIARSPAASKDARVLAIGGSLLLAVPSHRVRPNELRRLLDELRSAQTRVVGTVLVASRARRRGR